MADEVPVCDVLCEAMEYLVKLGSNLRSRSESLKEKKIRKDRLKNSHAVHKAARKVLTICELSKKSLENVETGVKRVLSLVDTAQRSQPDSISSGGKKSRVKSTDNVDSHTKINHEKPEKSKRNVLSSPRRISISGKSYNLRLPRRISLRHFMSVKVLARQLPKHMIEKYPVYLNCKLYDEREQSVINTNDTSIECRRSSDVSDFSNMKCKENKNSELFDQGKENNEDSVDSLDGACKSKISLIEKKYSSIKDTDLAKTAVKQVNKHSETSESEIDTQSKKDTYSNQTCVENDHSKKKETVQSQFSLNIRDENNKRTNDRKSKTEKSKKRFKKLKIYDSSSSENEEVKNNEENEVIILDEEIKDKTIDEMSKGENKEYVKQGPDQEPNDKLDENISKEKENLQENEENKEYVKQGPDKESNEKLDENISKEKENDNKPVKPLIKCVSISKLLKPDIVDNEDISNKKVLQPGKENAKLIVHMTTKRELTTKYVGAPVKHENKDTKSATVQTESPNSAKNIKKVRYVDIEEFWEQKREEVRNFKPKKLTINIIRLPKFSIFFLNQNNLKRITHSGSILSELSPVNPGDETCVPDHAGKSQDSSRKYSPISTNDAKNALLNDSDDDIPRSTTPNTLGYETENVKNSLLDDSESDRNIDQENNQNSSSKPHDNSQASEMENSKIRLLQDSESDKDENQVKCVTSSSGLNRKDEVNETENSKSSFLEDSTSNKSELQENIQILSIDIHENSVEDGTKIEDKNQTLSSNLFEHETENNFEKDNGLEKDQYSIHLPELGKKEAQHNKSADETPSTIQGETKNESTKVVTENQDKDLAKSFLMNDSSDSSTKPESKKRKHETTIKSRRKHIMESMHAKKMLLTYSSSSDTEDEQLKNVIKNIKDDLMKGIEDDDAKCRVKKKILSSSESDDGILKMERKKRKTGDDSSPRAQATESDQDKEKDIDNKKSGSDDSSNTSIKKTKSSMAKMGRSREKSGGSSNQNSDSQEDKDIEGLTNLKTLNKVRRRRDSGSEKSASTRSSTRKMAKEPQIFNENLLSPDSSGEDSPGESDGPEEDLPPVSLASVGLNGDGIDHLAKDDLLEESESDTSKDKNSDVKKEDDSDSSTVKARRRKAKTISSDSEPSSSRRKPGGGVKISDFEDSEDENSEPIKRKRKKKDSDSDASGGSSSDGKKKRKRIKQIDSDVSGSDTENEGKSKHGRKNIRKVMGKNQLEEATKKAARQEKERVARIAERQKMYNNLEFDESGKPDEVIVDKVVLDFDPETKEPLIELDRGLVKKLKPHQANGIKFMWDACFESVKRIKKDRGSGCILAHCMGLGKTLQVVSLTHTLLTHSALTKVQRVLVVCPLSTVLNWVNEFRMWLKFAHNEPDVDVYELSRYKQNSERAFQLSQWFAHGGVCVLGYEMFRNLSADNPKKFKKKMLRQFQESLVDPGPDLVVCDEGHLLKNEKTSLSQSMNRVRTLRRIVLTGTPLQNNLKEYYCMVQFVKPNLLGKYNEYLNRFVNPITNGQYTDSTEHDIRIMKRRSHVLHKMLDGAVQRRDYGVLAPFLPPKHEYVLFITLTDAQITLYQHYLDNYSRRPLPGKSSGFLFPDFQSLQRIWTHPLVLKYNSERYEIMQQKKREREEEDSEGSLVDFIDDDSTPEETSSEESTDDSSDMSDDSRKKNKKKKSSKKSKTKDSKGSSRRNTRANPVDLVEEIGDPSLLEVKSDNPTEWWIPLVTDAELDDLRNSHKLVLLFEILRQCEAIGDKLLVFSQSLYSLDLIEHFLGKVDEATQEGRIDEKLGNHVGSWSPGIDYFRLDGSTSCENRSIWCKNFNREDNPRARLFLISTRAGGLGINLVAANRVVIFDVSWNPSHDVQSIFRVYRFGQKKPCYIYRFLAMGTMEEKIYERQVTKQAISKRVIDEQQIDRHYAENDLAELYKFEPRPPAPRPVPLVPKDRLFAEMLKDHEALIYKFHEHDSLLENKEEETLSEEERKAAWDDFENEKNRPPPQPFPAWPMHNGMPNMNLMAAQQQQLAYAALAGVLRKDMPTLTDDNIRQMLPLLYSSNPALMQKLSDMYKYAQPGMMNPQMMNMNAGSGGGGGASGLQYEPPWQRQQQQQQQMRMQQLMQQQNQMGAKFYAGGLGSRDPVAMALQQQRAREIMLGGGGMAAGGLAGAGAGAGSAGRPRGRPPLAPRAPPTTTNDVVNLDSD